ncbi:hypothetical protein J4760_10705 [Salinicoccus sp. ID82-1]|uniref:Uncharacterized protein n=1 Tax=Salinicoccus cyprini TaxID=2493691 RepID=A0A558AV48_9STAP|nr:MULTISPECIES: hypothetical protein [Salinicoccus]MCG1010489.1 hypothetical protein [Salinicoccus sp. ID82-1]TVT28138.1 hypothetical protein FO441_06915 [Salinicoccus cyprini]
MKHISMFIIAPILLFLFLILITDPANALGGVFIYMLVMLASHLYDRYRIKKSNQEKNSGK